MAQGVPEVEPVEQVAKFAISRSPQGFDPIRNTEMIDASLQRQVIECLVEYDYLAGNESVVGQLATSWSVSEDGLEWRFQLRKDARFYDPFENPLWPNRSRAVTAHDVLFSWLRQADARGTSGGYWAMDGILVGIEEYREATANLNPQLAAQAMADALREGIPGIEIINDHELLLRLQQPDPRLLNRLAMSYFGVYPHEAVAKDGRSMRDQPVGSAPFAVADWLPGQTLILQRTPNWRKELSPFGDDQLLPYLDRVEFHLVSEAQTSLAMFKRGEIARLGVGNTARKHYLDENLALKQVFTEEGIRLFDYPIADTTMLCFGMEDPVVGDLPGDNEGNQKRRLLRRALALAFPYEFWAEKIRGALKADLATSFLPPAVPDAEALPPSLWNHQDFEMAKKLLVEAGYPNGQGLPAIEFVLPGAVGVVLDIGNLYRASLKEIGVELELVPIPYQKQLERARNSDAQIFLRTWILEWPDGTMILQNFHGPSSNAEINLSRYHNPIFDDAFETYRAMPQGPERDQVLLLLHGMLEHEVPAVAVDHRRARMLVQPWLSNFHVHPFNAFFSKYYRVTEL